MQPTHLDVIGSELAIKWDDGHESYFSLEALRRACPCAACAGETDALGRHHRGPAQTLGPTSFQIHRLTPVGGYAIQIHWGDQHSTGLYSYALLRRLESAGGDTGNPAVAGQ